MSNLDHCPFCGGKAYWHTIGCMTYAQCIKCKVFMGVDGKDNIQGITQKWNRRIYNDNDGKQ